MFVRFMSDKINTGLVLEAFLAEYNVLKTEIQNRSGIQNTLIQIHITFITTILALVFSQSFGEWLIFLIPVEATLFGILLLDHSLVISDVAVQVKSIETQIN